MKATNDHINRQLVPLPVNETLFEVDFLCGGHKSHKIHFQPVFFERVQFRRLVSEESFSFSFAIDLFIDPNPIQMRKKSNCSGSKDLTVLLAAERLADVHC